MFFIRDKQIKNDILLYINKKRKFMVINSLSVDINTFQFEINNRTKGKRLRLYLGEFINGEFIVTVDTIQNLELEKEQLVRDNVRTIILSKLD
jgi:hypothetical protein